MPIRLTYQADFIDNQSLVTEIMESSNFETFTEASAFAKSLAHQGVAHNLKRNGASWVVEHETFKASPRPIEADVPSLLRKIVAHESEIESLKKANAELQSRLDIFASNFDEQVAEQTAKDRKALDISNNRLTEAISRLKAAEAELASQKHKLELLEGVAEVQVVKELVQSKEICPWCGGDGGVKGGCKKCDGNGWIDITSEESKEVVKIK